MRREVPASVGPMLCSRQCDRSDIEVQQQVVGVHHPFVFECMLQCKYSDTYCKAWCNLVSTS